MQLSADFKLKSIKILYEDSCYFIFDKPPGLLVIPTPKKEKNTLAHIVNDVYAAAGQKERLYPCHRLDRDTSGAILFAKGEKNQQLMMREFKRRSVRKKYIALIHGRLEHNQGEMRSFIKDFDQQKFERKADAKLAITRYRVFEARRLFSIVEVYPLTGRTNQIRIHFSEAGHPLLGERKYAFGKDFAVKFRRTALHASELQWLHPVYGKTMTTISPLPADMERFILENQS